MALTDVAGREAARVPLRGRARTRWGWGVAAALATAVALAVAVAPTGAPLVRPGGLVQVGEFLAAAVRPRVDGGFLALTATAALTTLGYAVLGSALSLALGAVGGLVGSRAWWRLGGRSDAARGAGRRAAGWTFARAALVVPRGIHEVVWGLLLLGVLGLTPVVAVLAIAIPYGAITAKVFAEILDDTDPRPAAALVAAGAGRASAVAYGLLPAAAGELLSYAFYRFECAIRSAAVLGLVGSGGLGFQLSLSFSALRYDEIWTLLWALVALCVLADATGSTVRRRLAEGRDLPPATPPARRRSAAARRRRVPGAALAVAVLALPAAAWWTALDLRPLVDGRSWQLAGELLAQSWPPTLGAGPAVAGGSGAGGVTGLLTLAAATLAMSVLAIAIAIVGGVVLAGPAARPAGRDAPRRLVSVAVRAVLVLLRAVPPPVWALLVLFVLRPGLLAGAVALGLYTLGVLGRLMAETVENLDPRPGRALRALGASGLQRFAYGTLPVAAPRFAAYGLYRWEVTIRETVVVGVVGAGGLGRLLGTQLALFDYGGAVTTIATLLLLTLLVDLISAAARRAVR